MNIYKYHKDELNHKEAAFEKVPYLVWMQHNKNHEKLKKYENVIAKDPVLAYRYAKEVLKQPFPLGEKAIAKSAWYSWMYARLFKGQI